MTTRNLDREFAAEGPRGPRILPKDIPDCDLMTAVRSDACVLLTGRDDAVRTLAHEIHRLSRWSQGPFTIIDCECGEDVLEGALYGPAPGTAPQDAPERAGTVLLHEVGRLDRVVQARLADRLMPVRGHGQPRRVRRRLMASTSEPLLARVHDGTFDDRLFYRLNVIHFLLLSDLPSRPTGGTGGADEGFLLRCGIAHDERWLLAPARRMAPRLGLPPS